MLIRLARHFVPPQSVFMNSCCLSYHATAPEAANVPAWETGLESYPLDKCVTSDKSLPDQFPHLYKEELRIPLWTELCAPFIPS